MDLNKYDAFWYIFAIVFLNAEIVTALASGNPFQITLSCCDVTLVIFDGFLAIREGRIIQACLVHLQLF